MLTHLRNLHRPACFHYHHRLTGGRGTRFEGWYYKVVDAEGRHPFAIIPGVFLGEGAHAFVQVLDGARCKAFYHRFALSQFSAARDVFDLRIGNSRFREDGIELDIDGVADEGPQTVRGELRFADRVGWPVTGLSPGCMGPFGLLPFMECYHGILSVDHGVSGALEVDGQARSFEGGRGYTEKDWGRGFPEGYVWMQSNHFARQGVCITASVAKIPLFGASFRGFLAGFLLDGALHRFTTYSGARVTRCAITDSHVHVEIEDARYRLAVDAEKAEGPVLNAPYEKQMLGRVAETMQSVIGVRFSSRGGAMLFEGQGQHGCLEAVGNLAAVAF